MFKTGITPAWEDPVNEKGSDFKIEIKNTSPEQLQQAWEKMVFDMVTGNFPEIKDGVAGVRVVQRAKNMQFTNFKIEVWMTCPSESHNHAVEIKKYLENEIISKTLDMSGTINIEWSSHSNK